MKNRNTSSPKTRLRIQQALIYGAAVALLIGIFWKVFLGTAVIVVNTEKANAMFTPAYGQQVTNYNWESTVLVDHTQVMDTVDLVDFPLLVSVINNDLKTIAHGGYVESNHGYDIIFCGENDAQLDHQIESYDPTTGTLVAWVNLPLLYHSVDTELKITCGNPSLTFDQSTQNTWSSNVEAVWHMSNDPSSSDLNDAAGAFNGSSFGNMTSSDLVQGKIGSAIDFDGINDYFAIQNKTFSSPSAISEMTVSSWVKTSYNSNSWTANWSILDFDRSEYFNFFVHGKGKISFCSKQSGNGIHDFHGGQNGQVNDDQWHYVVASYDGSKKKLYIDGVLVNTSNTPANSMGSGITRYGFIGEGSKANSFNGSRNGIYYQGKLDEIRLYNVSLSSGRIATIYNNQSSPETFVTFGNTISNLPIELGHFSADLDQDIVNVEWSTLSQRDNDYFTIERSSDGNNFESIGEVKGTGNSNEVLSYDFIDNEPVQGLSYYRLRQTDFNGETETFNAVAVKYIVEIEKVTIEKAWPNPFKNDFKVQYTMGTDAEITISLANSNGMQVFSDDVQSYTGENEYKFVSSSDLVPGVYFLNIIHDGEVQATIKLLKQ